MTSYATPRERRRNGLIGIVALVIGPASCERHGGEFLGVPPLVAGRRDRQSHGGAESTLSFIGSEQVRCWLKGCSICWALPSHLHAMTTPAVCKEELVR